jgi:tetratricopeptide (TPR) repeat protein
MIEKILHGVNVGACCTQLVTQAVEIGSSGGVVTLTGAVLSGFAIFKGAPKEQQALAEASLDALLGHLTYAGLHPNIEKQIVLMLDSHLPGAADLASANMEPGSVAALMRERVLNETHVPEFRDAAVLDAYEDLLKVTLEPILAPRTQSDANQAELLKRSAGHDQKLDAMMALVSQNNAATPLIEAGITEKAIIGLAQKIAAETDNVGQAWAELQNAMEMAVRVQADGRVSSNHGDFVDEVLKRVAALSAEGEYASAGEEIDAALSREEQESKARRVKLLERGVEVALLDRDTQRAAELLVRRANLEAGGTAGFGDLRTLQNFYFERGRDKGINLDLELAIDLAELIKARADSTDELGTASNDLGLALGILGERESGTVRLKAAVKAYEAAMEEWAKDTLPFEWAMTQNNLGLALQSLGERESGTARLEEAVEAYGAALQEWTRDKVPIEWAATQNNLGNALYALGERESGTARLEEAVEAFEAALEEWTRDDAPLQWATTQNNLGNALAALGQRESGTARLEAAAEAYRAAREEQTRERVPLDWAKTQNNLASLEIAFFGKTGAANHLNRAEAHVSAAREVFLENGAEHHVGITDEVIAAIQVRRSGA